jgi:hypothetical protein
MDIKRCGETENNLGVITVTEEKRLNIFNTDISMQTYSERSWSAIIGGRSYSFSLPPQAKAGLSFPAHYLLFSLYFY